MARRWGSGVFVDALKALHALVDAVKAALVLQPHLRATVRTEVDLLSHRPYVLSCSCRALRIT